MFSKSKLSVFAVCTSLAISVFAGCNTADNSTVQLPSVTAKTQPATSAVQTEHTDNDLKKGVTAQIESTTPNTALFQDIYNEYSEALISKTYNLINEFNSEAEDYKYTNTLETLLEQKKEELTIIFNEGLEKIVETVGETKADSDEYEFWHNKLEDIYNSQLSEFLSNCAEQNDIGYSEDADY